MHVAPWPGLLLATMALSCPVSTFWQMTRAMQWQALA